MEKKKYNAPTFKEVNVEIENVMLTGSGGGGGEEAKPNLVNEPESTQDSFSKRIDDNN